MKIQESAENYLEAILMLTERQGYARAVDIAGELGFSKASVSIAMKQLRENGFVEADKAGRISVTEQGMEIARAVYEKHKLLAGFLAAIGVSEETARRDACRIEHCLSEESFRCIRGHAERLFGDNGR